MKFPTFYSENIGDSVVDGVKKILQLSSEAKVKM